MRVLILGAGAVGGYFGARLLQAGRDATFLVRQGRAAQLAQHGLSIKSGFGDILIADPPVMTAERLDGPFDLVLLTCKAFDLDAAIADFAPAVGPDTAILPLLNGMRHIERLQTRFGERAVLGGRCLISAAVGPDGVIRHLDKTHNLTFGEIGKARSERVEAIQAFCGGALFDARASDDVLLDMWEKWVFLASLAGMTCLAQAAVGDIVAAGGGEMILRLFDECRAIATAQGCAPRPEAIARATSVLTQAGSRLSASMLRDLERGAPIEADHIIGDLLRRRAAADRSDLSLLVVVDIRLKAYEARRSRSQEPALEAAGGEIPAQQA
jgi:2-dehydropantoate 2-reductase